MEPIKKRSSGLAVGRIQQALIEAGYTVPQTESMASVFGEGTYEAIRAFQASHLGPGGHPLTEDGIVGDDTWFALKHPGLAGSARYIAPTWRCEPLQERIAVRSVLALAVGEIGVFEDPDGSNDGPRIRQYTAPNFIGDSWCALFASWCFEHGCDGGSPFKQIAGTWSLYEWALSNNKLIGIDKPILAGDIGVILRGARNDPKRRGHTVIFSYCKDLHNLSTIEGNASNAVRGVVSPRERFSAVIRPIPVAA